MKKCFFGLAISSSFNLKSEKTYHCSYNDSWIATITHPISLPSTVEKWKMKCIPMCSIVSSVCWHEIIERIGDRDGRSLKLMKMERIYD